MDNPARRGGDEDDRGRGDRDRKRHREHEREDEPYDDPEEHLDIERRRFAEVYHRRLELSRSPASNGTDCPASS